MHSDRDIATCPKVLWNSVSMKKLAEPTVLEVVGGTLSHSTERHRKCPQASN